MMKPRIRMQVAALMRAWLLLDFFGDARRSGEGTGSSLTTTIMWQSLLAFLFAMLLYPEVPPVPFAAANLCLSTLLVSVGALGDEQRPARLAADANLLAGAPVSSAAVVLARSGHAAFHLVLVTTGMAISPAILLAHLTGEPLHAPGYVAAACACIGVTTAALATARALCARLFGDARATLLMGTLKAAMLGGGFVLFALALRQLDGDVDGLPIGRAGAELLPTYHAAKLLWDFGGESWRLLPWAVLAAALLLTNVLLDARRPPDAVRVGRRPPLLRLLRAICGPGPSRGVAEFVALQMWRSAGFRGRVLPLLGLPAGMVFLTLGGEEGWRSDYTLFSLLLMLPAIYLPFLIAFLPRADQAKTGWVFAHAPPMSRALVSDATWRALTTHVLLPTYATAAGLVLLAGPDRADRAAAAVYAFSVAVLAAERMARIDRVPFSDDREEDRGLDFGVLMTGALALGLLGTLFGGGVAPALRWPVAAAAATLAALRLRRRPVPEAAAQAGLASPHLDDADAPSTTGGAATADADQPEGSIGRELRAVAVLYVVLCALPWLAGSAFAE
ncbi:MAG: hypothetical protein VXY92_14825 [Planctomycetota bacterium]|nr:hypothetical protein [Planctomycetota bacterium]